MFALYKHCFMLAVTRCYDDEFSNSTRVYAPLIDCVNHDQEAKTIFYVLNSKDEIVRTFIRDKKVDSLGL